MFLGGGRDPHPGNRRIADPQEDKEMANKRFELADGTIFESNEKGNYFYKSTGRTDKKGNPVMMRVSRAVYEQGFDQYIAESRDAADKDAENNAKEENKLPGGFRIASDWDGDCYSYALYRGDEFILRAYDSADLYAKANELASSDKEAEDTVNGKKEQDEKKTPAKKSRKRASKDIAYTGIGFTLTAKQVDFIKLLPGTCFWEEGIDSTLWCDCIAEDINWNPMSVGAMISTLREKHLVAVAKDMSRKGHPKAMQFTDLGKQVATELGLQ
jgi:hypothetical protein